MEWQHFNGLMAYGGIKKTELLYYERKGFHFLYPLHFSGGCVSQHLQWIFCKEVEIDSCFSRRKSVPNGLLVPMVREIHLRILLKILNLSSENPK